MWHQIIYFHREIQITLEYTQWISWTILIKTHFHNKRWATLTSLIWCWPPVSGKCVEELNGAKDESGGPVWTFSIKTYSPFVSISKSGGERERRDGVRVEEWQFLPPELSVVIKRAPVWVCRHTLQYTPLLMLTLYSLSLSLCLSLSLHTSLMESVVALLILFTPGIYTTNALLSLAGETSKLQHRSSSLHLPLHFCLSLLHCLFALHSTPHFLPLSLALASVYRRVLEAVGVWWRVCVYSVLQILLLLLYFWSNKCSLGENQGLLSKTKAFERYCTLIHCKKNILIICNHNIFSFVKST